MDDNRIPIDEEDVRELAFYAHDTRHARRMYEQIGAPTPGSHLESMESFYPFESVEVRTRYYIQAALEHLSLWADYSAPLKFDPEQSVQVELRPVLTLSRSAIESASQAIWILSSPDQRECARRHLSLLRWDLEEERKSRLDANEKLSVRETEDDLIERVSLVFTADEIRPPGGYLEIIGKAAKSNDVSYTARELEQIWRVASGAAHGKFWVARDNYVPASGSTELKVPYLATIFRGLAIATDLTKAAVLRFADWSGADIAELIVAATSELAAEMPLRPDADMEIVQRLREGGAMAFGPSADGAAD